MTLPSIQGLADDRPNVGTVICMRFRDLFGVVLRPDGYWTGLSREDEPKLEQVRACYHTYVDLLSQIADSLAQARVALTHGDLAGDNLVLTQDGRLTIVDWGSARISAAWLLLTSLWSKGLAVKSSFCRTVRCSCLFEESEISVCLQCGLTAHLWRRLQVDANRRSFRFAKQCAAVIFRQLHAAHAGRLAAWHAGDGRGYGWRDATGRAAYATFQRHVALPASQAALVVNPIPALTIPTYVMRTSAHLDPWRRLGSSTSRKPSPSRLNPATVVVMQRPG